MAWRWVAKPCGGACWTEIDASRFFGVPEMPVSATVKVSCSGVGCPGPRRFGPRRRSVKLNAMFAGRQFAPGTVIQLRITAPNRVGRVVSWTMLAGAHPVQTVKCLPPGARKPLPCTGNA